MTLSNNAIKFLQAQYRAIFKRAYIKGLATAVLLTAGLAATSANADVYLSTQSFTKDWNSGLKQYELVSTENNYEGGQVNIDHFVDTIAAVAGGNTGAVTSGDVALITTGMVHYDGALPTGDMNFMNVMGAVNWSSTAKGTTASGGNLTIGGTNADINGNVIRSSYSGSSYGGSAFGGLALNSADEAIASGNTLTVQADKYADAANIGGYAFSSGDNASTLNNTLNYFSSKVVQGIDTSDVAKTLAGGYARSNSKTSTVTISGNTLNLGSASNSSATDIKAKTTFAGGFGRLHNASGTITISNNTANLTNVTLTSTEAKYIVGGGTDKGAGSASMTGNKVVLNDVTVSGSSIIIAGAYDKTGIAGLTATGNSVTVGADSVITDASIYSTYSKDGYYESETDGQIQLDGTYNVSAGKSATLAANDITVSGKITNAGTLTIGTSTADTFIVTGGSMSNTGTVVINSDQLSVTEEYFNGLFTKGTGVTQGKLNFSGSAINVDGAVDLNELGIIGTDGVLTTNNFTLNESATLTANTISLDNAYKADKLVLDTGTLNIAAGEDKKFIFSSGTITVRDVLNGAAATDRVVIKAETEGKKATLNLIADEQGKVTNIDRFNVGWTSKASGTSTLSVEGTWDFGGARVTASNNGKVNFDGTVSNVSDLMLEKNGAVTVNGNLTIERLLAGEDNNSGSSLVLNGKLTVVGDNREGGDKGVTNYYNDVSLTQTTVTINNGGTLAITKADALDDFLTVNKDASGAVTGITVSATGDKTTDIGGWSGDKVTLNAGGTLQLNLAELNVTSLSSTALKTFKESLVAEGFKGSFDFGAGFTVDLSDNEELQTAIDNGEVSYSELASAGVNDVKGVADNAVVTVDSTTASGAAGINLSTGKAVELEGTNTVNVNSLVLTNTTGDNFVYTTTNGNEVAANVAVTANGAVNLTGNGTVGSLTKASGATGTSAVLTAGQGAIQTVKGKIDLGEVTIGAGTVDVTESVTADELNVNGTLTVSGGEGAVSIGTTGANIAGTLNAGAITSSGDMAVTGAIAAQSIILSGSADSLSVGDSSSSGLVEVETLDLNDGMLLIDPDWTQNASFVAVTTTAQDVVNVNGSIGVGQNSVGVFGATAAEAQESLSRLGLLQSGKLDEQGIGAALYLDDTLQIANQKHVLVDKNKDNSGLSTDLTGMTGSGSVTLREGSALVISESFSNELVEDQSKAIFNFAAADGTVTVSAESGAEIIFDSADILGGDTVTVATKASTSTATITTTLDDAEISAAGGLLEGTANGNTISFSLAQNAADHLYNQSNPIRDMTLDVVGNQNGTYDSADAGVYYIGAMNAHNGGADIERTARMALYGGAVQATLMAQQTSTDAISERLGMANPNSALIASNNAQGGGLWLSPVYKNHDSDEFEAEGVNYGADIDLYGLALGADFTTESGVRVGAMFNVGSGDAEGQGIGEGVSNDFDYYGFSLYAGVTFGNFALTADAGFTQVSNDLEQAVNYHGVGTLKADTDTQTVSVGVRGEYLFATPWVDVVPHVGVRYTSFDMDSYQAQVDGYTIANADADSMQVFSIPFGVTFSKDMAMGNWVVKPVFDLNLTANAGDDELESDVAFVGVSNVALTTEVMDSFTYGATLGVSAQYQESFSFGLNVGYTGSSSADEFGVNANARYTF